MLSPGTTDTNGQISAMCRLMLVDAGSDVALEIIEEGRHGRLRVEKADDLRIESRERS
jgi:hypothetical protein